jgi:hypothetical protein
MELTAKLKKDTSNNGIMYFISIEENNLIPLRSQIFAFMGQVVTIDSKDWLVTNVIVQGLENIHDEIALIVRPAL